MNWVCNGNFFAPGEVSKGQISFNYKVKVNFKDFYTKLCVCCHKWKIQNISDGHLILSPGSCPRGRTLGSLRVPRGSKKFFFKHGHVAYKIGRDQEHNKMQVKFLS